MPIQSGGHWENNPEHDHEQRRDLRQPDQPAHAAGHCNQQGTRHRDDGEGPNGEDCSNLTCNTLLPDEAGEPYPVFAQANALIRRNGRSAPLMFTTEHGDGSKTMTAVI